MLRAFVLTSYFLHLRSYFFEPDMIEKRMRRTHNCPNCDPRLTRNSLVFEARPRGGWCKTQRILELSSQFVNFERLAAGKSLTKNDLTPARPGQSGVQNSRRSPSSVATLSEAGRRARLLTYSPTHLLTSAKAVCSWPLRGCQALAKMFAVGLSSVWLLLNEKHRMRRLERPILSTAATLVMLGTSAHAVTRVPS